MPEISLIVEETQEAMDKAVEVMQKSFASVRTGKA